MAGTVTELAGEADLTAMLAAAKDAARQRPGQVQPRLELFHLMVVMGDWAGAARQLAIVGDLDTKAALLVSLYRPLVMVEPLRAEVFAAKRTPPCLGRPPAWLARLVEALRLDAEGAHGAAKAQRDAAFAEAPAVPGRIGEEPFAWLADADERLGPVLEAVVNGAYYWVPMVHLAGVETTAPRTLRDLVWLPARLLLANGGDVPAFLPVRYPGSEAASDTALRLARRTEWRRLGSDGSWIGLGQRMLATDRGERALLDVRRIELDRPETALDAA